MYVCLNMVFFLSIICTSIRVIYVSYEKSSCFILMQTEKGRQKKLNILPRSFYLIGLLSFNSESKGPASFCALCDTYLSAAGALFV